MILFLEPSPDGKTATLSLGNEPGGDVVATMPFETRLQKIRAYMLAAAPEAIEELNNLKNLSWFGDHYCPSCQSKVPGAPPAAVQRISATIGKATPEIPEDPA